jgi:peptide subunit release factor 1 (eRF1)
MLDRLLGRAELKQRVAELEEETERLRERYESADERRATAESARQEAEREVNRLEDRVAELEDRVERAGGEAEPSFRGREALSGARRDAVLARLQSVEAPDEGALAAMVDSGVPETVADAVGDRAGLVRRAAPCLVCRDDAGVVSAALVPPDPPDPFVEWGDGFRLDPAWFRPTGRFAFALVRSDRFALGEYDGEERQSVDAFESDVTDDHSKGGFSQGRFERRREEQIADHLRRCETALADRSVERLYLAGEATALDRLDTAADATATVAASGDVPAALDRAFEEFWTVRVRLI